ncbi:hypothetical protein DRN72_02490 [Methanosarcinales archaeon]|nr:MAG: hypothetical protein DRN72_02490 [Methanosarcinales archaeon]
MILSIVSGKGGTGKTTVAVNLALSLSLNGRKVEVLDCDVEEPNIHLFIRPNIDKETEVVVQKPVVDEEACTRCGICEDFCQFNSIAVLSKVIVFEELCHGCGGCSYVCPQGAITETQRRVGVVRVGKGEGIKVVYGTLDIGEYMPSPVIRCVRN